jgi:hypothetical protein
LVHSAHIWHVAVVLVFALAATGFVAVLSGW